MNTINLTTATLNDVADWMLDLVDNSENRLAIVEVPYGTEDELDVKEEIFRESYDIAKARRPNLAVKIVPPGEDFPDAAVIVAIHEHKWVGGSCLNGCPDRRAVA
jgi:hypothetical protein